MYFSMEKYTLYTSRCQIKGFLIEHTGTNGCTVCRQCSDEEDMSHFYSLSKRKTLTMLLVRVCGGCGCVSR